VVTHDVCPLIAHGKQLLAAILRVLADGRVINSVQQANEMLAVGKYSALTLAEMEFVHSDMYMSGYPYCNSVTS
jgi:hypothetical protein